MSGEAYTAVEYEGEILEFVGRTVEDSRRRAELFCKRHASATMVVPDWVGDDDGGRSCDGWKV